MLVEFMGHWGLLKLSSHSNGKLQLLVLQFRVLQS